MASKAATCGFLVIVAVMCCICNTQNVRWCTISEAELKKCVNMSINFEKPFSSNITCVPKESHAVCITAIEAGDADVVTLDGGDIYTAGKEYNMKPVVAEDYGNGDFTYWAVAVARVQDDVIFTKLKGKKSCHTGIGKTSGWNIPIGILIEKGDIKINEDECDVPQAVGNFFTQSCVPGALDQPYDPNNDNPDNLCKLCIGTGDAHCSRSHKEPYYDYSGSFRCLADNAGEVAFMKHTTVPSLTDGNTPRDWGLNLNSTDFKLLCEDGTTENNVNNYESCNLASVPSHAVMTSGDKSTNYVKSVHDLLINAQKDFGPDDNENGFKMFDSSDFNGVDLLFKDSTQDLKSLGDKDTYEKFLGEKYLEAVKAINCDNGGCFLRGPLMLMVFLLLVVFSLK